MFKKALASLFSRQPLITDAEIHALIEEHCRKDAETRAWLEESRANFKAFQESLPNKYRNAAYRKGA